MQLNEQWDKDTILYYIESDSDTDDNVTYLTFSFGFYDCEYLATVAVKDIDEDNSYSITLDGDSRLFDSFEKLVEGVFWPKIKEQLPRYIIWYNTPPEPVDWTKNKLVGWEEDFRDDDYPDDPIIIERKRREPIDYKLQAGEYFLDPKILDNE